MLLQRGYGALTRSLPPSELSESAMTALWIGLGVVGILLLVWRLRRAAKTLDRILREEHAETEADQPEHEYRNR